MSAGGSTRTSPRGIHQNPGIKKGQDPQVLPSFAQPLGVKPSQSDLDCDDVRCLRTLLALGDSELNFLAFGKGLKAFTNDGAVMREHVGAIFLLDETKTLSVVEPFNCTFCHFFLHVPLGESVLVCKL